MSGFASDPQVVMVSVDVSGLDVVLALAHAARNVVDGAADLGDGVAVRVPAADFAALERALAPLLPGAVIE